MTQDLKTLINAYLEGKESRTVQSLSQKAGVSYTSVRRILQDEIAAVSLQNALSLLEVVTDLQGMTAYLKKHFPKAGSIFEKRLQSTGADAPTPQLAHFLDNYESYVALLMAGTQNGALEQDIVRKLGENVKVKIESMLDAGVLELRNGRLFASPVHFTYMNFENLLKRTSFCSRLLREESIGQEKQFVSITTDGVSREGQVKLHELMAKYQAEIDETCKKYPGSIVFFGTLMMGEVA